MDCRILSLDMSAQEFYEEQAKLYGVTPQIPLPTSSKETMSSYDAQAPVDRASSATPNPFGYTSDPTASQTFHQQGSDAAYRPSSPPPVSYQPEVPVSPAVAQPFYEAFHQQVPSGFAPPPAPLHLPESGPLQMPDAPFQSDFVRVLYHHRRWRANGCLGS